MRPCYRCQDGWVLAGVDKENFVAYKKQRMKKRRLLTVVLIRWKERMNEHNRDDRAV